MSAQARLRIPISEADHSRGPADAPITLVEYGDFQCPSCGQAFPVVQRLMASLNEDMRFVFRHFPLTEIHPEALGAAKAAEAAGRQGRFWKMHDLLFKNQSYLDLDTYLSFASALRLDVDQFENDLESRKVEAKISSDFEGGVRSGVNGTPAFFVNGIRYDGDWSFRPFLEALSALTV
jgi:protein-disulfide isomerase